MDEWVKMNEDRKQSFNQALKKIQPASTKATLGHASGAKTLKV